MPSMSRRPEPPAPEAVFLRGTRVSLRPLAAADLTPRYLSWLNDPEVSAGNSHAVFPETAEDLRRFYEETRKSRSSVVLAIVDQASGRHVGNVALQRINWVSRSAEFAILLGDKAVWGKGLGFEAMRLIVDYAFARLNLHRVHCGTFSTNAGMRRMAEKLGMREEGVRREAVWKDGRFLDVHEYGILKDEYARRNGAKRRS